LRPAWVRLIVPAPAVFMEASVAVTVVWVPATACIAPSAAPAPAAVMPVLPALKVPAPKAFRLALSPPVAIAPVTPV
jgi:hypothetical protein